MARIGTGDGFKFWASYYDALKVLPSDEARGRFVRLLCAYVFDGTEPTFRDEVERFGFELIAAQALESKRLTAQARERGVKSGESRRKKAQEKQKGMQEEFSTGVFDNQSESVSESVSERKYVGLSLSNERESGAAGAGPWGPAPPRLEDLPPIPGQRDTNGGDRE